MGLTSALLQSYFVRYPLNPSSTLALPKTSRKPLLKQKSNFYRKFGKNHPQNTMSVSNCSEIMAHHIKSHMLVQKSRQEAAPVSIATKHCISK